jgi:catechol 2,3-dioxygenase-like lactoylglutathione lyase family enzyme
MKRMQNFNGSSIDHLNIGVSDTERSRVFYEKALAPLGIVLNMSVPHEKAEPGGEQARAGGMIHGFGLKHKPYFWITQTRHVGGGTHIAFSTDTRANVDAFYKAAIAAGGKDNGAPGIRYYHKNYYGAFVLDPDGINVEAVCHAEE